MSNALINPANISFVFNSYPNYFMALLVMPQLPSCIFEVSVMTSIIIFPLKRARPQVSVVLSRSLTII